MTTKENISQKASYFFICEKGGILLRSYRFRPDGPAERTLRKDFFMSDDTRISNVNSGIDYRKLGSWKAIMETIVLASLNFPDRWGLDFEVVRSTVGKSAVIFRIGGMRFVLVLEGLGTKIEVALAMQQLTGLLFYRFIAKDNVAMAVNDAAICGAKPLVYLDYAAVGNSSWFDDVERARDLGQGFLEACREAYVALLGGESPALPPMIFPHTIDLAGAVLGVIDNDLRWIKGDVQAGDDVIFIPSNGSICSNGISPLRTLAERVPSGYLAEIGNGMTFGEAILQPTPFIVDDVQRLLDVARPHAIEPLTGGGFLKIARCRDPFTYVIKHVPELPPLHQFIMDRSGSSIENGFTTWNMGVLAAVIAPKSETSTILGAIKGSSLAGHVEEGPRQVVLEQYGHQVLKDENW
jgi:phosphoribosylformylglycinamidine cyclo-ligase